MHLGQEFEMKFPLMIDLASLCCFFRQTRQYMAGPAHILTDCAQHKHKSMQQGASPVQVEEEQGAPSSVPLCCTACQDQVLIWAEATACLRVYGWQPIKDMQWGLKLSQIPDLQQQDDVTWTTSETDLRQCISQCCIWGAAAAAACLSICR